MPRLYRAVPLDNVYAPGLEAHLLVADSDLDAAAQAKGTLGPDTAFVLWEGDRQVLTFRSVAELLRMRRQAKAAAG